MDPVRPELMARKGGEIGLAGGDLCALVSDILGRGKPVRFKAAGRSMSPMVRDGDIVVIHPFGADRPRTGDVVAFIHPAAGRLAIHRVICMTPRGFIVRGDNTLMADGCIEAGSILGRVTSLEREGRRIRMGRGPAGLFLAALSRAGFLRYIIAGLRRITKRPGGGKDDGK